MIKIKVIPRTTSYPTSTNDEFYLKIDNWNDYSFVTLFDVFYRESKGEIHEIGQIKIGFRGQTIDKPTHSALPSTFEVLDDQFFSVGQDVEFYTKARALLGDKLHRFLSALRDISLNPSVIESITDEPVFNTSLLRYVSIKTISSQFSRVIQGYPPLTDYQFSYTHAPQKGFDEVKIRVNVKESSTPSTNIHALIGRNGVGKTTILHGIFDAIISANSLNHINDESAWHSPVIGDDYFSSVVSVSFSAFDPFDPPQDQPNPANGIRHFYIGLKDPDNQGRLKTIRELHSECINSLKACFINDNKAHRWLSAIEKLNFDEVFALMGLTKLPEFFKEQRGQDPSLQKFEIALMNLLSKMSSGHSIVFLTITRLVATVEEKTLVLIDEPESHLHPPLLSAFIRALSELLHDRNGVSVIATHSPVVLQEIPKSCVSKIYRYENSITCTRPTIETFGENVGLLTAEVFGLELLQSGFHALLSQSVKSGKNFDEILEVYGGQLGFEARMVLGTLIANRGMANAED
ncbi:ea59 protein [Xanthomonas arboricola pv. juglandis]|uniref:AAA family ATPase n=1 Tax=Xanthomonas TaxID=338 RepID=UPI000E5C4E93|nr:MULTISPECIES: AAA family ATPase [Xanthomonas]CAD1785839.1 AAA family ATPase [Xanthomonas sp. CPBF 426]CAG2082175.1 AAA family ATPase [Xanthomonas euroxanthea]SYZ49838.1 ea59 protein [Xanthomonas arboricola pv. juglandis]